MKWPTIKPPANYPFDKLQREVNAYMEYNLPFYSGMSDFNFDLKDFSTPESLWDLVFMGGYIRSTVLARKRGTVDWVASDPSYYRNVILGNCCGGHLVSARTLFEVTRCFIRYGHSEEFLVEALREMVADPTEAKNYHHRGIYGTFNTRRPGAFIVTTSSRETPDEVVARVARFGFKKTLGWVNGKSGADITMWTLTKGLTIYDDANAGKEKG